mgnify:CR=1 FL=1
MSSGGDVFNQHTILIFVMALLSSLLIEDANAFSRDVRKPYWKPVVHAIQVVPIPRDRPESLIRSLPNYHGLRVLSPKDAERYRKIFDLQSKGNWELADREITWLDDKVLVGHLQFQRYMHPTEYRSKFMELAAWLEDYSDHPGSHRIYRLAIKRMPESGPIPVQPDKRYLRGVGEGTPSGRPLLPRKKLSNDQRALVSDLESKILSLISRGMPTRATKLLDATKIRPLLTDAELDRLNAKISRGFYSYGKDQKALSLADKAAQRSRRYVPEAYWVAGLASWRLGEVAYAVQAFQNVAANESGGESLRAAGAFWAARAHAALGNRSLATSYFSRASRFFCYLSKAYPESFKLFG